MQERSNDRANRRNFHQNFFGAAFGGDPVWYIAAMTAVGIYFGVLVETLRAGEVAVTLALLATIVLMGLLHIINQRHQR